jgi:hypothetical protein
MMMMKWNLYVALLLVVASIPVVAIPAVVTAQTQADQRCFDETGFCIAGRIREYWEQHGGLPVFGYPVTPQREEMVEGQPFQVQWFERNRMELHPENAPPYDVLLGRLGDDCLAQQQRDWVHFAKAAPQDGCLFFAETGHTICGDILAAWQANGLELDGQPGISVEESQALFGLPVSQPQREQLEDGNEYVVQWFERARFELHPENQPPHHVLLGLLGDQVLTQSCQPVPVVAAAPACEGVPDPVNATIRPGKCVQQGEIVRVNIAGFAPQEEVSVWVTAPDGSVVAVLEHMTLNAEGKAQDIPIGTTILDNGLWTVVFKGRESDRQAIVYFSVWS